jgi:hypothetical protein
MHMSTSNTASKPDQVTLKDGRIVRVRKYHTEAFARDASRPGSKQMMVLGDVSDKWGKFWVCRPVDAARLVRDGFEHAPSLYGIVQED